MLVTLAATAAADCVPCDKNSGATYPLTGICCPAVATRTYNVASCGFNVSLNRWVNGSCWTPQGVPTPTDVVAFAGSGSMYLLSATGGTADVVSVGSLVVQPGVRLVVSNLAVAIANVATVQGQLVLAGASSSPDSSHQPFADPSLLPTDAAALAAGLRDCATLKGGFVPRICGPGVVAVASGGELDVDGFYAAVLAPLQVQAGGQANSSGFIFGETTVFGTLYVQPILYAHGAVTVMPSGSLIGQGSLYRDGWADSAGSSSEQFVHPVVDNFGTVRFVGLLAGSHFSYAGASGIYAGVLHNHPGAQCYVSGLQDAFTIVNDNATTVLSGASGPGVSVVNVGGTVRISGRLSADALLLATGAAARVVFERADDAAAAGVGGVSHVAGTVVVRDGATVEVRRTAAFFERLAVVGGAVEVAEGGVVNLHAQTTIYCWESVWKYCSSCSDCTNPTCRQSCPCCGGTCPLKAHNSTSLAFGTPAAPFGWFSSFPLASGADAPAAAALARLVAIPTARVRVAGGALRTPHGDGWAGLGAVPGLTAAETAAMTEMAEAYLMSGATLRGDGTGSVVAVGALGLVGPDAVVAEGVTLVLVADHGAPISFSRGGGAIVAGRDGVVVVSGDVAVEAPDAAGAGRLMLVAEAGGAVVLPAHSRVRVGARGGVDVRDGGALRVGGAVAFDRGSVARLCGAVDGPGAGAVPRGLGCAQIAE